MQEKVRNREDQPRGGRKWPSGIGPSRSGHGQSENRPANERDWIEGPVRSAAGSHGELAPASGCPGQLRGHSHNTVNPDPREDDPVPVTCRRRFIPFVVRRLWLLSAPGHSLRNSNSNRNCPRSHRRTQEHPNFPHARTARAQRTVRPLLRRRHTNNELAARAKLLLHKTLLGDSLGESVADSIVCSS
jgi:hypothetical protein